MKNPIKFSIILKLTIPVLMMITLVSHQALAVDPAICCNQPFAICGAISDADCCQQGFTHRCPTQGTSSGGAPSGQSPILQNFPTKQLGGNVTNLIGFALPPTTPRIEVNSTDDTIDPNDNKCTLREALISVSLRQSSGDKPDECKNDQQLTTIHLPSNSNPYKLKKATTEVVPSSTGGTQTVTHNGTINFSTTVQIVGDGPGKTIIDGSELDDRVFRTPGGVFEVDFNKVTIRGGNTDKNGGGILWEGGGTLKIENCHITDNNAKIGGGGIATRGGTLIIINSTFSSNNADLGGGIAASTTPTIVNIINSTFSDNKAITEGAAIYGNQTKLFVDNSTITNNVADEQGLGVGLGGGLFIENGSTATIANSILAGSIANNFVDDCHKSGDSKIISGNFNIFGGIGQCAIDRQPNDRLATNFGELKLGGLAADKDGSTPPVRVPQTGSPAIDNASPASLLSVETLATGTTPPAPAEALNFACADKDELGETRVEKKCDIGAVEFSPLFSFNFSNVGQRLPNGIINNIGDIFRNQNPPINPPTAGTGTGIAPAPTVQGTTQSPPPAGTNAGAGGGGGCLNFMGEATSAQGMYGWYLMGASWVGMIARRLRNNKNWKNGMR
jgi:CSLREA domain-containing protein